MSIGDHKRAGTLPMGKPPSVVQTAPPYIPESKSVRFYSPHRSGLLSLALLSLVGQLMWWSALKELLPQVVQAGLLAASVLVLAVLAVTTSVDADATNVSVELDEGAVEADAEARVRNRNARS